MATALTDLIAPSPSFAGSQISPSLSENDPAGSAVTSDCDVLPFAIERRPRMLDMFAGAGGTGLGFRNAGFHIVGVVEWNKNAAETYSHNLKVPVVPQDIREIDPKNYRESLGLSQGELEVLVGCSPCQGFSDIRNGSGLGDERNQLVLLYLNFIREFMPRFVLFENVAGIRARHGLEIFEAFCKGLRDLNYEVRDTTLDAADYGVPQRRERVLVVAGRDHEAPPFPDTTHAAPDSACVKNGLKKPWKTVRDAIGLFPAIAAGENGEKPKSPIGEHTYFPNHVAPKTGKKVLDFLRQVPHDGGSRRDVIDRTVWLKCHLNMDGKNGFNDVYGRLSWDKPAGTLTTGCTNPSKGRFSHPEQDRALSACEAGVIQGFPLDFAFKGSCHSTQIGNAVPPPLAEAIAKTLFERLQEVPVFQPTVSLEETSAVQVFASVECQPVLPHIAPVISNNVDGAYVGGAEVKKRISDVECLSESLTSNKISVLLDCGAGTMNYEESQPQIQRRRGRKARWSHKNLIPTLPKILIGILVFLVATR